MTQLRLGLDDSGHPADGLANDPSVPGIIRELARVADTADRRRKILVARTLGEGKELLRQLALLGRSWVGFEVTTVRPLAMKYASGGLARAGLVVIDAFEEHALAEQAIDDVMSSGRAGGFGALAEKTGFRDAVRNSLAALRLGGIRPGQGAASRAWGVAGQGSLGKRAFVAEVLGRYESLLRGGGRTDTAGVLAAAIRALESGAGGHGGGQPAGGSGGRGSQPAGGDRGNPVLLVPGLRHRGLAGRFLRLLRERGAVLVKADPALGLPVPDGLLWDAGPPDAPGSYLHAVSRRAAELPLRGEHGGRGGPNAASRRRGGAGQDGFRRAEPLRIELFAAASVSDELRGVLRRALEMGARWDQVEIVATDPASYGSALHALAEPLGVPVTFAVGLPVERTRPGRVVSAYFRWVESGFQESVLRGLVEAGDLRAPRPRHWMDGPRLARALRRLRIGWGRERHTNVIARALRDLDASPPRRHENEEQLARRKEREADELRALRDLVEPVIEATPIADRPASPADFATGVMTLLTRTAEGTETDETAQQRLTRLLERIAATVTRTTDFASASAIVQSYLQIRIPAPRTEGMAPWSSAPGHLYLTDLRHGGATGRPFTFVVGLDSGSLAGSLHEDPLLDDRDRWRLGRGDLPLAADRAAEARFNFAQLVARQRGTLVLSCPRWSPAEARELTPAPEMLQGLRLRANRPSLTFDDLSRHLGLTESRLPRSDVRADLDGSDVWLRALSGDGGKLRAGLEAVGRSFPRLEQGLAARNALSRNEASVHAGLLGRHTPPLSYENIGERVFSASGLGHLGACPRRFLFSHVLRAYPPDDPEFDPDRWLNALERGGLLHAVYEGTLKEAAARDLSPEDARFMELALSLADREGARALLNTPSPSDAVHQWEMEALRDDVRSFVEMIRGEEPPWSHVEWRFGADAGIGIRAGAEPIRVRGIVDRVDDHGTHFRVIDYKTGSDYGHGGRSGTYYGGRRLQHFVYSTAVSRLLGKPVDRMEYHFPTRRGENRVRLYPAEKLASGDAIVATLAETVRRGWFPATDNAREDCRFCDYQDACGVEVGAWGAVRCAPAEWTLRNLDRLDELELLRRVRGWEE